MSKIKIIACHDCGAEIKIKDAYEDLSADDLQYCPCCGVNNIEVSERDK